MANVYRPEGLLIDTPENRRATSSLSALREAMECCRILEARAVVCDSRHNLVVDFGFCRGVIPRMESVVGIEDGSTRDIAIISRVGKAVCFVVTDITADAQGRPLVLLSRRKVQEMCRREFIATLCPGDVVEARVTHLENFGCFVDIACGITSLIPIDAISISRIAHPQDRFRNGQDILAVVRLIEEGRITLSHKELLGDWEQNACQFSPCETVAGIIRSVESYGVFVELTPNLAGLAEPHVGARPGLHASVYIKSLIPERMKIKLIIVDCFDAEYVPPEPVYHIESGHISRWRYSPICSERVVESVFE